jgi:hypothetical protein
MTTNDDFTLHLNWLAKVWKEVWFSKGIKSN